MKLSFSTPKIWAGRAWYRAVGLLRLKNKTILCFDMSMTLQQIKEYRLMGYGVAIL